MHEIDLQKLQLDRGKENIKRIVDGTPSRDAYEVNTRMVVCFREIGQGLASIETFSRIMNMPRPMNKSAYNKTVKRLRESYFDGF